MTQSLEHAKGELEQLIAHLTHPGDNDLGVEDLVLRARETFDGRTASGVGWALVDALSQDGSNLETLEALMVLGMAHPRVLEEHSIALEVEGRRLVTLLERSGRLAKARELLEELVKVRPRDETLRKDLEGLMRRTGETQELADEYLRRARAAADRKNYPQAIQWLQEILLHDRSRRDVARMIKELRHEMANRERRIRSIKRNALLLVLVGGILGALCMRELRLFHEYQSILSQSSSELRTARAKLAGIESLVAGEPFWIGKFTVEPEVVRLREEIVVLETLDAKRRSDEAQRKHEALGRAGMLREEGLLDVQRRAYDGALVKFREALELGGNDWTLRERVTADVLAIEEFLEKER